MREENDPCCCCTCGALLVTVVLLASGIESSPKQVTFTSPMFLLSSNLTTVSMSQLWNDTVNNEDMRCFIPFVVTTATHGEFQLVNNIRRRLRGHAGHSAHHSAHSSAHSSHSRSHISAVRTTSAVIVLHTIAWTNKDELTYLDGNAKKYVLYQDQLCVHDDKLFVQADEDLWGKAWFGRADLS